jgi:UDP-N-acetylglucosamine 4-epimerase
MRVLVTGGAGFIGSNLVSALLKDERFSKVKVLDNLSTGFEKNIEHFLSHNKFSFIKGDITDPETCKDACTGIDAVSHQAALGSVPRSIKDPLNSHRVNVDGYLNMLDAARLHGIKRFVYASSSSVYGDANYSPKREDRVGTPLSPYAVTKLSNELYANVYHLTYGMETIGLRYFNVFGPNQDPNGPYAAVIPLFFKAALSNQSPLINGDGTITRDFTYIDNVIEVNMKALTNANPLAFGKAYNIACGSSTTLNQVWESIKSITGCEAEAEHGPQRQGDILQSLADISLAKTNLGYDPAVGVTEGLKRSLEWYKKIAH